MDYPTNNQPSYFGFFGEATRRSHLDQPVSTIATSSKRFAVEKNKRGQGSCTQQWPISEVAAGLN